MASSKKKGTRGASRKSKYRDDPVDDEEEFVQTFDVAEKLRSKDFPRFFIKELLGTEVTYDYEPYYYKSLEQKFNEIYLFFGQMLLKIKRFMES